MDAPAQPSFRKRFLLSYLFRLWISSFLFAAITLCYALFGAGGLGPWEALGLFSLTALASMAVSGLLGFLAFSRLESALRSGDAATLARRLRSLPRSTAAIAFFIGLSYVALISAMGLATGEADFHSPLDVADFLAAVLYAYAVIPAYAVHTAESAFVSRVKMRLHAEKGLSFEPAGLRIRDALIAAFVVVAVLPAASLVLTMAKAGVLASGAPDLGYTLATILILIAGIIITIVFRTGAFTLPILHLGRAAAEVKRGDLAAEVPIISDDELGGLMTAFNSMTRGLRERERITDLFGRMVAPEVRDHILSGHARLGGSLVRATVLFSDIRDFTGLSERMAPEAVVALLNRYFERMSQCVQEAGGLVNKFVGDAIMALFGIPIESPDHADAALRAAVAMQRALRDLNAEFAAEGLPGLKAGIGVHTGMVLAGNIGSSSRMEYTAIGDAVNLASRIEGLTKSLAEGVLASAETMAALGRPGAFASRRLLTTRVKGRDAPVELFEILDGLEEPLRARRLASAPALAAAIALLESGRREAEEALLRLRGSDPGDKIVAYYLASPEARGSLEQ